LHFELSSLLPGLAPPLQSAGAYPAGGVRSGRRTGVLVSAAREKPEDSLPLRPVRPGKFPNELAAERFSQRTRILGAVDPGRESVRPAPTAPLLSKPRAPRGRLTIFIGSLLHASTC